MGRIHFHAAPVFLMSFAALAQTQALPSFEVASVKPAAPQVGDVSPAIPPSGEQVIGMRVMFTGPRGGPGGSDPGRITYLGMSMKSLLLAAYGVKAYQLSGPSWMETERVRHCCENSRWREQRRYPADAAKSVGGPLQTHPAPR
jgi:hypothetical protein